MILIIMGSGSELTLNKWEGEHESENERECTGVCACVWGGIKIYFIVKSNLKTPLSLLDTHFLKAYLKFSFFNISNISILGDLMNIFLHEFFNNLLLNMYIKDEP